MFLSRKFLVPFFVGLWFRLKVLFFFALGFLVLSQMFLFDLDVFFTNSSCLSFYHLKFEGVLKKN